MPPRHHTQKEETDFMNDLLSGIDTNDFFKHTGLTPSPEKPPIQHKGPLKPHVSPCEVHSSPSKSITQSYIAKDVDMNALLVGADDWDDITVTPDSPVKIAKPIKPLLNGPNAIYTPDPCTRCVVESVNIVNTNGKISKRLYVKLDQSDERRTIQLQDDWVASDVQMGDVINVIGQFSTLSMFSSDTPLSINVTSKTNLVILFPDLLLTATSLSDTSRCLRKPLLSLLIRSTSNVTPALVWGNILHLVMQSCLAKNRWDEHWMNEEIRSAVQGALPDLIRLNMSVEQAEREVKARAKGLNTFAERYMSPTPKTSAHLSNTRAEKNENSLLAITGLLDAEEDIWSPTYGLKGKLDASVNTIVKHSNGLFSETTVGPKPLELKTGRSVDSMEHRAQTMLYNILASERYGLNVTSGLLYYTHSEEVVQVPSSRNEIRGLITARNALASYIMRRHPHNSKEKEKGVVQAEKSFLPKTIDVERTCNRCFSVDACMLYRKAIEGVVDNSSEIANIYSIKTSHLTAAHSDFFKHWENLLSLEEQDLGRLRKELWTMNASEREAKGRCFSSMIIDTKFVAPPVAPLARDTKIHQFTYRFIRVSTSSSPSSLLNGSMSIGDAVTVSVEPHLLALARGFISDLAPTEIVVDVDHNLSPETIQKRLEARADCDKAPSTIIFRIDRDELFGGMSRIRGNLAELFYAQGDVRRRELVVDLRKPLFSSDLVSLTPSLMKHVAHLNKNQTQAMWKALSAEDYALILGMPGTGKTTVISALIKTLVGLGKTVLLTSYTHSAVDNILMKLQDGCDFSILRLGNIDKVHPDVRKFTLVNSRKATTVEQMEHQIMTPPVVATTCLSVDHALFSRRTFDYCIVDEASQITLPTCLGPLRFAERFVLVGDHFQLPPLVRNGAARKGGLDISLFRRLSDTHPEAVIELAYQYRMNSDIMVLSNKLIYGDRLRCGSDDIANQTLKIPDPTFLSNLHAGPFSYLDSNCWLTRLLLEESKAIFVDTDLVPAQDSRVGDLVQNEVEANLIYQFTETLIRCGITPSQIGVISLYRQQIKLLGQCLRERSGIEILTADRSQGRDKDCIIISMVRSNDDGHLGDLIKDWRRMNVSFTRARKKLVIFGSRRTLSSEPLLKDFFALMESRKWIMKLRQGDDCIHARAFDSSVRGSKKRMSESSGLEEPQKKIKGRRVVSEAALLKNRPILRDFINEEK